MYIAQVATFNSWRPHLWRRCTSPLEQSVGQSAHMELGKQDGEKIYGLMEREKRKRGDAIVRQRERLSLMIYFRNERFDILLFSYTFCFFPVVRELFTVGDARNMFRAHNKRLGDRRLH